jgi:SAM-dependent methyltransferase
VEIDYAAVGEKIRADYRSATAQYRRDDELEVTTPNHRRLGAVLQQLCRSFPQPIRVLEAGCGTGRYFHCLRNVLHLTGIDISEDMLAAAKDPVLKGHVTVPTVELVQGNIFLASFPSGSFDFIYSLGMFGHGCPVTAELCNRFYDWLSPRGQLLFNVVDFKGLPWAYRARRLLRTGFYPLLPLRLRRALDEREKRSPFFALTKRQLLRIMSATQFKDFSAASHRCQSPLWRGRHLECVAKKVSGE